VSAVPQAARDLRTRAITLLLIVLLLAVSAITIVPLWRMFGPRAIVAPNFTLIDQDGRPFTLSALRGHPVVVFFGYTHCPDVCPTTLAKLAEAVHSAGAPADVRIAFVTVDPQRDSPAVLKRYVRLFDPQFFGLTGTLPMLLPIYAAYHTSRKVIPASAGQRGYTLAHGTTLYYVGRNGFVRGFGGREDDAAQIAYDLKRFQ
jgi:protein SCO1/2